MTDSNRDHSSIGDGVQRIDADDAPLAPKAHDIHDDVTAAGSLRAENDPDKPQPAAVSERSPSADFGTSKDIVLQRLSSRGSWDDLDGADDHFPKNATPGLAAAERRSLSMAAVVLIAAGIGALGGGLVSAAAGYFLSGESAKTAAADQSHALDAAIAKLNADLVGLKSSGAAQSGKIIERMDRLEKAQAEPAAKLAKLSEAVDKLRAPEVTGSITAPAPAGAAAPPNRLPVISGWVLRDVGEGAARVEGRLGIYEVYPGDPLPGLGRVDAIRHQDGRWVVVTSRGLIVAR